MPSCRLFVVGGRGVCVGMGNLILDRGWRRAILCALFSFALSAAAIADSSVTQATSTPNIPPKHRTGKSKTISKSSSGGARTHKSAAHKSAVHKTTGKKASHKSTKEKTTASRGKRGSRSRSSRKRGQQAIDHDRALAIQEALIREHYLQGEPSGTWDATTQAAMRRYQADQGWQSKTTPDSRALIKLGLGPSNDHLLNPESAMTSTPVAADPKRATKPDPAQNTLPQQ